MSRNKHQRKLRKHSRFLSNVLLQMFLSQRAFCKHFYLFFLLKGKQGSRLMKQSTLSLRHKHFFLLYALQRRTPRGSHIAVVREKEKQRYKPTTGFTRFRFSFFRVIVFFSLDSFENLFLCVFRLKSEYCHGRLHVRVCCWPGPIVSEDGTKKVEGKMREREREKSSKTTILYVALLWEKAKQQWMKTGKQRLILWFEAELAWDFDRFEKLYSSDSVVVAYL